MAERALTALAFSDVVGYTERASANEEETLRLVADDFATMTTLCAEHGGKVLKSLGDGLLMSFDSAARAVDCAIEIQKRFTGRGPEYLQHRIGVHLADVVLEASDAFGDGVNVTARLQHEASPGGIALSKTIYEVVRHRLTVETRFLGERKLRNVPESMGVYEILLGTARGIRPSSPDLPRRNLSVASAMIFLGICVVAAAAIIFLRPRAGIPTSTVIYRTDDAKFDELMKQLQDAQERLEAQTKPSAGPETQFSGQALPGSGDVIEGPTEEEPKPEDPGSDAKAGDRPVDSGAPKTSEKLAEPPNPPSAGTAKPNNGRPAGSPEAPATSPSGGGTGVDKQTEEKLKEAERMVAEAQKVAMEVEKSPLSPAELQELKMLAKTGYNFRDIRQRFERQGTNGRPTSERAAAEAKRLEEFWDHLGKSLRKYTAEKPLKNGVVDVYMDGETVVLRTAAGERMRALRSLEPAMVRTLALAVSRDQKDPKLRGLANYFGSRFEVIGRPSLPKPPGTPE